MSAVFVHRYRLAAKSPANRLVEGTQYEGALVRIGSGFGCIHPWPELGDLPLDEQLQLLKSGKINASPLLVRTMEAVALDGKARESGVNLFDGLEIPESHWLWNPDEDISTQADELGRLRIGVIKVKCDGSANDVTRLAMVNSSLPKGMRYRLDLNGALGPESFADWWESMPAEVRGMTEFIEDPMPYNSQIWSHCRESGGVEFALDRSHGQRASGGFQWRVIKPAVDGPEAIAELPGNLPVVFTSYMDHPLGQLAAALVAARELNGGTCNVVIAGLASHTRFEANAFSERLALAEGGRLIPPEGTGFGFDDLLESLDWKKI